MENRTFSVISVIGLFRQGLKDIYKEREIDQFIYILFSDWKGWNRLQTYLNNERSLTETEVASLLDALDKLKAHVPIQYITGKVSFCGLQLAVTPDVLIPRPETEELLDLIIKGNEPYKDTRISILDIGTGSGCIAISLKSSFPGSSVLAVDSSIKALKVAEENAESHRCRIEFSRVDIFDKKGWEGLPLFDLIVSNPPYVLESEKQVMGENVVGYEPAEALYVPDDDALKYYHVIAEFALLHLSRPGLLYLEINERFGFETVTLLLQAGFSKAEVMKDINGKDRFIRAELNIPEDPPGFLP